MSSSGPGIYSRRRLTLNQDLGKYSDWVIFSLSCQLDPSQYQEASTVSVFALESSYLGKRCDLAVAINGEDNSSGVSKHTAVCVKLAADGAKHED